MPSISAAEFKAKCLSLMDEVQQTGKELIITKRGKPVAKLVAIRVQRPSLIGSMKGTVEILGDIIEPVLTPEEWGVPKELLR